MDKIERELEMKSKWDKKRIINNIFKYYLFTTIICHVLFYIAPIASLMIGTPFYNFQRYLGVVGVGLIVLDFFTSRYLFKAKNTIFLYLLSGVAVISSILHMRYGIKENLFDIVWSGIIFAVLYPYAKRVGKDEFLKQFSVMFKIISVIWTIACIISIFAFLFNSGYHIVANPYFDKFYIRQGFLEYRLFGVFMSIFSSSMMSGTLLIFSLFYCYIFKKKIYIFNSIIYLLHIILSGSRSSIVSLGVVIVIVSFYYWFKHRNQNKNIIVKLVISFLFSVAVLVLSICGLEGSKKVLSYLPTIPVFSENRLLFMNIVGGNIDKNDEEDNTDQKIKKNLLEREDTDSENISNNRFDIWKDYLFIYKDINIVGLSPNNFSEYIQEYHPDLYIAKHIREAMPNRYSNGDVYEPHSGYVYTYVATGIVGITLVVLFLVLSLRDVLRYLRKKVDLSFYPFILVLIFSLTNATFDSVVFFDPELSGVLFWIIAGYISYLTSQRDEK